MGLLRPLAPNVTKEQAHKPIRERGWDFCLKKMPTTKHPRPSRRQILTAFLLVYVIWGSTYLGMRFAIETIPPLLMAGVRFVISGTILYIWARLHGAAAPQKSHWKETAIIGGFLLLGGNGGVVYAEQTVPSGIAALLVSTVPLWMVLMEWLWKKGKKPTASVITGVVLGMIGVVLLAGPSAFAGHGHVDPKGTLLLMIASVFWAFGSLYSRGAKLPASSLLATAMEMLTGGLLLLIAGTATGEWAHFSWQALSLKSVLALGYLIVFGALVGFSAYIWLLRVVSVASVSTYAYVNPVIAVFLGCLIGAEPLTMNILLGAVTIVTGVAMIVTGKMRARRGTAGPAA